MSTFKRVQKDIPSRVTVEVVVRLLELPELDLIKSASVVVCRRAVSTVPGTTSPKLVAGPANTSVLVCHAHS